MSIPKPDHIAWLYRQHEAINHRYLRDEIAASVKREREHGTNIADGYSNGGGGGGSGHGDPTVSAVVAREQAHRDLLRRWTHQAADSYEIALKALQACETALRNIATAIGNQPSTPKSCDLCTEAGLKDRPWDHAGTSVAGKLTRSLYLCTGHYQFIWRTGQEPAREQTLHWDRTGSWRIRESA